MGVPHQQHTGVGALPFGAGHAGKAGAALPDAPVVEQGDVLTDGQLGAGARDLPELPVGVVRVGPQVEARGAARASARFGRKITLVGGAVGAPGQHEAVHGSGDGGRGRRRADARTG